MTQFKVSPATEQFVKKQHRMFINGYWLPSYCEKTFPVINPATGRVLAHVAEGDKEDINRAVIAARKAFETGPLAADVAFR